MYRYLPIRDIYAREILDSGGNPALEAEVLIEEETIGRAAVPSGSLAADSCGGDRRGKMAAVIRVDKVQGFPYIDFRVDDHPDAVVELNKIYQKNKAHIFETYDNWVENVKQGVKG